MWSPYVPNKLLQKMPDSVIIFNMHYARDLSDDSQLHFCWCMVLRCYFRIWSDDKTMNSHALSITCDSETCNSHLVFSACFAIAASDNNGNFEEFKCSNTMSSINRNYFIIGCSVRRFFSEFDSKRVFFTNSRTMQQWNTLHVNLIESNWAVNFWNF